MKKPLCSLLFMATAPFAFSSAHAQSLDEDPQYLQFKTKAVNTRFAGAVPIEFRFCIEEYDKLIAGGVAPDTRVPDEEIAGLNYGDPPIIWTGTLKEIKDKWCEAGLADKTEDVANTLAPYRAALKNDKLDLVIDSTQGHVMSYALPGGEYTDDPEKLAAAPVWFLDVGPPSNEIQNCDDGGRRNTVRRYTFDAEQKLTGTTSRRYCGDPPGEAYR